MIIIPGTTNAAPRNVWIFPTIRRPSRNSALAENADPNTSKIPPRYFGTWCWKIRFPSTPKIVISIIGFKMMPFATETTTFNFSCRGETGS